MDSAKYIGLDVHKESISIAVLNAAGKIVMECVIETKASTILDFLDGLRGELHVTFEEGTWADWLYDLIKPHVMEIVVCDPRRNALLKEGNKSDRIDARKLAELLYLNKLQPVYHGEHGARTLKELVRSYLTISKDLARVMTRVKALYRSWAIPCTGKQVYAPRTSCGLARQDQRAGSAPPGIDALRLLRQEVRRELLTESKKHKTWKLLCQIPSDPGSRVDRHFADTTSAPNGNCGPSAVWASRYTAVPITVMGTASYDDPIGQYRFAV